MENQFALRGTLASCSRSKEPSDMTFRVREVDITDSIGCLRYYAGWADKIVGQVCAANVKQSSGGWTNSLPRRRLKWTTKQNLL